MNKIIITAAVIALLSNTKNKEIKRNPNELGKSIIYDIYLEFSNQDEFIYFEKFNIDKIGKLKRDKVKKIKIYNNNITNQINHVNFPNLSSLDLSNIKDISDFSFLK